MNVKSTHISYIHGTERRKESNALVNAMSKKDQGMKTNRMPTKLTGNDEIVLRR